VLHYCQHAAGAGSQQIFPGFTLEVAASGELFKNYGAFCIEIKHKND
jgi:hypothetical protein